MKIAYFDCSAGISGDMCLGALVDAGVPLKKLIYGLRPLSVKGYKLEAKTVKRNGIVAAKVDVIQRTHSTEAVIWKDIEKITKASSLPEGLRQRGLRIFRRLFEAEGRVHGKAYNRTHLHELGAVDCIVDIFGTLIALDIIGVEKVFSSAVNLGSGFVVTEHGRLPVPAPATAELLKGFPAYSSGIPFELTTPTGAAILSGIADSFPEMPLMNIEKIGYGAGRRDIEGQPNMLRIFVGESLPAQFSGRSGQISVIETNIDDMNPQIYEYVMERLFGAGALDAYLTQVIMKKGRPGVVLTVLCTGGKKSDMIDILFRETTTIGVRCYEVSRAVLERNMEETGAKFGRIKVKASRVDGRMEKRSPEYEDCKRIARSEKMPLIDVMRHAIEPQE